MTYRNQLQCSIVRCRNLAILSCDTATMQHASQRDVNSFRLVRTTRPATATTVLIRTASPTACTAVRATAVTSICLLILLMVSLWLNNSLFCETYVLSAPTCNVYVTYRELGASYKIVIPMYNCPTGYVSYDCSSCDTILHFIAFDS